MKKSPTVNAVGDCVFKTEKFHGRSFAVCGEVHTFFFDKVQAIVCVVVEVDSPARTSLPSRIEGRASGDRGALVNVYKCRILHKKKTGEERALFLR